MYFLEIKNTNENIIKMFIREHRNIVEEAKKNIIN